MPFSVMAEMRRPGRRPDRPAGARAREPARRPRPPVGSRTTAAGVLEIRGERDGADPHRRSRHAPPFSGRGILRPGHGAVWSSRAPPGSPSSRPSRSRPHAFDPGPSAPEPVHRRATLRRAMAVPRPAHAGADRGRAGEPRRASRGRSPCVHSPRSCGRGRAAAFHTDPIALDTFTHLLGCWGLDCLEQGDVIFPLRMGRLSIHGDSPATGTPSPAGSCP